MSSGPFFTSLGVTAAFAIRSMYDHPDRDTAEQIADAEGGPDAEGVREGLEELREQGLAVEGADGRWSLTDAGRERAAAEPA